MLLTDLEASFYAQYQKLKLAAGSHSPSIHQLLKSCPQIKVEIDACYLCNPYAFDLFMDHLSKIQIDQYIKFYPAQNFELANNISLYTGIPANKILIGNGAIELISSIFSQFSDKKILLVLPAFSAYYELAENKNIIIPYYLKKENNFQLNTDNYIEFIKMHSPDVIVLINPNNPTGTLIKKHDLIKIHQGLNENQLLIIDESFIHFTPKEESIELYATNYSNIIIIRSLSKDFGIAGIRLGYAVMHETYIEKLRKTGYLWNSNGLAQYFTELLSSVNFQNKYKIARSLYINSRNAFFNSLCQIESIKTYPSEGNFFIIETKEDSSILFTKLLFKFGIYTRVLNDKIGLKGNFIRIASKNQSDNKKILLALKTVINS